jgi:peptide/nickel transport system substrate-binding protein
MTELVKITRRNFLSSTAMAAMSIVVSDLLLPAAASNRAMAADQKVLRISTGEADSAKGTLDPAFSSDDPDATRISLVHERLVTLDEKFAPKGQLAESWSSNPTADEWTFKIRPNVKFHDGKLLTSKDVVYTFKRLLDSATGSPAASSMAVIDPNGISAPDANTVVFKLKAPAVEFPALIANRFTYILNAEQPADQLRTKGVGTGPFKVVSFTPGEEPSRFAKNEHYWREGLPKVDAIELRSIPDGAARIAAIAAGQIDLVWDLPLSGLKSLQGNADVKILSIPSPFVVTIAAQTDVAPFNDARVREALKRVVDRDQIIQLVYDGHARVAGDNPVAPWVRYALKDPPKPRDVELAKKLLAEAGHGNGLELELFTSDTVDGFNEIATLFQAQAAEAGINVKITKWPANDYWDSVWLKKPFIMSSWSGRPADDALAVAYLSDAKWNETHWKNPEFDAAIKEARQTVDEKKRAELYQKAQKLLIEDGGAIIPAFPDSIGATRGNVSGWTLHPQKFNKDFSTVELK